MPVLADMDWQGTAAQGDALGQSQRLLLCAGSDERQFLMGEAFVKQNWNVGFDENGRPIKNPAFWPKPMGGIYVEPGTQGGTNWYPPSYSPRTGLFYVPAWDNYGGRSRKVRPRRWRKGSDIPGCDGRRAWRSTAARRSRPRDSGRANYKTEEEGYGAIRALDPKTGEKKWDFKMVNYTECGVLSTGGDLVFGGGMDGTFVALDATHRRVAVARQPRRPQRQRPDQLRGQRQAIHRRHRPGFDVRVRAARRQSRRDSIRTLLPQAENRAPAFGGRTTQSDTSANYIRRVHLTTSEVFIA